MTGFTAFAFLLLVLAVGVAITVVQYLRSETRAIRRTLKNAPRIPIATLTEGALAKVVGTVRIRDGKTLTSPLSGRACVAFDVVVEENTTGSNWVQRIRDAAAVDFDVVDETGAVEVRALNLTLLASTDGELRTGLSHLASPEIQAYLARHQMTSGGTFAPKRLRFREGVFAPGERVVIQGVVVMIEDAAETSHDASYRGAPKRPLLQAPAGGALLASDEPSSTK